MKKKLLLIFFVILVLILSFNNFSFASYSYEFNGLSLEIPDDFMNANYRFGYIRFIQNSSNIYTLRVGLFFSDEEFSLSENFKDSNNIPNYSIISSVPFSLYYFDYGTNRITKEDLSNLFNTSISSSLVTTNGYSFYYTNGSYFNPILTNFDIKDTDGNLIVSTTPDNPPTFKNPYFITTQEELETGNFDKLVISLGDYTEYEDTVYLQTFYYPTDVSSDESYQSLFPVKEIELQPYRGYYVGENNGECLFEVPRSDLGIDLLEGNKYAFHLGVYDGELFNRLARLPFTVGVVNPDDVTNDKLDQQTDAIKENTETQKGIWETIKDILSYINPFSENFFVYKLIELLVEAIKSLFIPSDDFLGTYFTDLKEWFSDRLGFLFYPFELVIDILNMILDIDFSEPVFNIPDITEPFSNKKLISATTFKFNDLLDNNTFNTIHSIYLVCVDVFVVFGLVNLFRKKYEEVTTK